MIGKRSCTPPYFFGNLNSAILSFILRPRASSEVVAAPVSMRAGSFTPHGQRMTFSTSPIGIFSSASTISPPKSKNETSDKNNALIHLIFIIFILAEQASKGKNFLLDAAGIFISFSLIPQLLK